MKKILSLFAISMLAGCGILRPIDGGDEVKIPRNARVINNAAREGTFLAIKKIYDDDRDERVKAAAVLKSKLDDIVLPILNNPSAEITSVLESEFLESIPEEYHGLMAVAYETLQSYYEFPTTEEILPEPYLTYLRAFLNGVRDGADKVLVSEGVIESRAIFIPKTE